MPTLPSIFVNPMTTLNDIIVALAGGVASRLNLGANTFPARASTGDVAAKSVTDAALSVLDDATVAAMVDTLGGASSTGTGGLVRATSPTLVTPVLGTPTSGVLSNCTGMDWQLLETATANSDAVVDFTLTGWTNSDYEAYCVVYDHVAPETDDVAFWLRTSTDGGSTFAASAGNYDYASWAVNASGGTGAIASTSAAQIVIHNGVGSSSNESVSGLVYLFRPSAASYGHVWMECNGTSAVPLLSTLAGGGRRLAAADIDAVRFLMASGDIAVGGFRLYGLRNA